MSSFSVPPNPSPAPSGAALAHLTNVGRLLVEGADRAGIVATVSSALARHGANILSLNQYSSGPDGGHFFQRTVFELADFATARWPLEAELATEIQDRLGMSWHLYSAARPKRVAILASKSDHCLLDLLWRHRRGELPMDVAMVISNHPDLADDVRQFGVPYLHIPVGRDKGPAEQEQLRALQGNVDVVILARYMQILSGEFINAVGVPIINIHHSFLPAFVGAGPYQKAKERGVKLVGATAHYVTKDLDEGPIIEQDVVRVSHAETAQELAERGADVERLVLARAVKWHCKDRVIRHGNQTVVFS